MDLLLKILDRIYHSWREKYLTAVLKYANRLFPKSTPWQSGDVIGTSQTLIKSSEVLTNFSIIY